MKFSFLSCLILKERKRNPKTLFITPSQTHCIRYLPDSESGKWFIDNETEGSQIVINRKVTQEAIRFSLSHSPNSFLETSIFFSPKHGPCTLCPIYLDSRSWFTVSKSPTLKSDILQAAAADAHESWETYCMHCPILEGRALWQSRAQEGFRVAPPRACR